MAAITFHINNFESAAFDLDPTLIHHGEGSGLGFFGNGFGISVPVLQYQDQTWVTNSDGTDESIRASNTKYASVSGLSWNGGGAIGTSGSPNYYAPLRISFTHSSAVSVRNCKLRIFDRDNIDNHATEVTTQVYELRHPHPEPGSDTPGAGGRPYDYGHLTFRGDTTATEDHSWAEFSAPDDMIDMSLTPSPGLSGLNVSVADTGRMPSQAADGKYNWLTYDGTAHTSTKHDWYIGLSASPQSIGSKTAYGLYMTLEYL